jgi:ABC-2 type transport system ATP-binding protein
MTVCIAKEPLMIRVDSLTKRYGTRSAVQNLSFEAPPGVVTGFLGPNGAGKTTTFRVLLGLADPTSGYALIDNRPYRDLTNPRRTVGALLESTGLHPGRSGIDHLRVIAAGARLERSRCEELLDMVGLSSSAKRLVGTYSLGMKQRLAIAAALLGDPPIIVLDEPTNGLDPEGVAWLRGLTRNWANQGRTVIIASHLLAEVAQAVDRVVIINNGSVIHQTDMSAVSSDTTTVSCSDPTRLAHLLNDHPSAQVERTGETLIVHGATRREIGDIAAAAGVAIYELATSTMPEQLEHLFLSLTATEGNVA